MQKRLTREEKELASLRAALSATTRCTQAIIKASNESLLMRLVCDIIVDAGYYFCWVGTAERGTEKNVRPVAWAGNEAGYLSDIKVTWSNSEFGKGPAGTAIRTKTTRIVSDIAQDPSFSPWREEARKRGFLSVCAMPLMDEQIAFGVLCIYTSNPDGFRTPELVLLNSLSETLSYGVSLLRSRSEQLRMQRQLESLQKVVHLTTEAADLCTWDWDRQSKQMNWSDEARSVMGVPWDQDITEERFMNFIHKEDREIVKQAMRRTLEEKADYRVQVRGVRPGGEVCWMESWGHPILDESGDVLRIIGLARDVTETRRLEEEKQRLAQVVQNTPDFVGIANPDGMGIFLNRAGQELLGIGQDQWIGATQIFDYLAPEDVPKVVLEIMPLIFSGKPWAGELLFKNFKTGETVPCETRAFTIYGDKGEIIALATVARDLRQRKQMDAALRRAEEKYREIFDHAVLGIFQSTPDGHYLNVNDAMARMHGYASPQEMVEQVGDIARQEYVDPSRRNDFVRLIEEQGTVRNFSFEIHRKDGERGWVLLNARAVRDRNGQVIYYEGTQEDITERKKLEAQFEQAQKMEAVGRLAGGIAHDFNNILGVIIGYCDLTLGLPYNAAVFERGVGQIKLAAERGADLTKQLLAFSRQQTAHSRVLDLTKVMDHAKPMLLMTLGEDVTLFVSSDKKLGKVKADPGQIEQILMNLCVNARDAMPGGGTVAIDIKNVVIEKPDENPSSPPPGAYVMLSVSDTGSGIPTEHLAYIFEPFFTTKDPGKGTGLGLATVYGIVKQSGGHIAVRSRPQVGTSFEIYLPRVKEKETPFVETPEVTSLGGSETILLVEDEDALRRVAAALLKSAGYTVLVGASADSALALAVSSKQKIDLVITDVVMPKMSGAELCSRLQELRPSMKMLFMSGYAGDQLKNYVQFAQKIDFIEKPFSKKSLLNKVRAVLDKSDV